MRTDSQIKELRLKDALIHWSDPRLVNAVKAQERLHTPFEMAQLDRRPLLCSPEMLAHPTSTRWMAGPADYTMLLDAWRALETEFAAKLVRGEFHLVGVQTRPVRMQATSVIPGVWAAELKFDYSSDVVTLDEMKYGAVLAVQGPEPPVADAEQAAPDPAAPRAKESSAVPAQITLTDIRALSDEEVLLLLEDHARRVVEGPDIPLIAPGKISLIPLIQRKMEHRSTVSELMPTMADESEVLAAWIAEKVTSYQVPTAPTIAKTLASAYRQLKARSKATIQKEKG